MSYLKKRLHRPFSTAANTILVLLGTVLGQAAQAQCTQPVTHQSGTLQIGCTSVTVTPQDHTDNLTFCGIGPYAIGDNPGGSFTFIFSPPVSGVSIDLTGVDNSIFFAEEVSLEVNGVFYPITVPGTTSSCGPLCVILPNGRVSAPVNSGISCSWEDQPINQTISSLKIENVVTLGNPAGSIFTLRFCEQCCATDAGVLSGSPLQLCVPQPASLTPPTQTNLEPDDLLQYVLYTDVTDPEGSILATSNTPEFAFNPATMQLGVTYYMAAMAGNGLNGNVDLNDPCLDFSNALAVVWQPTPTVTFTVSNPDVCEGECLDFNVALTGTPPFNLTYTTGGGPPQTQNFGVNTGTIEVCSPIGTPLGTVTLAAVSLTDANCVCE